MASTNSNRKGSADRVQVRTGKTFEQFLNHDGQLFANYRLENCLFQSPCLIPDRQRPDPGKRPTIRNVFLSNARFHSGYLDGVVLEDVILDGLRCGRHPAFLRFNAYRHVTLKGKLGRICIRDEFTFDEVASRCEDFVGRWKAANHEYYKSVDWALDITDAETSELEISGVPIHLIRYDPEFAAILTTEAAKNIPWRKLPYQDGLAYTYLNELAQCTLSEALLIANRRSRNFKLLREDIRMLRKAGLAT